MRLSEKSIELNFCAEFKALLGARVRAIWFGLTQAQEARWGIDAGIRMGGRLIVFQFKASNRVLVRSGARRFTADHSQLMRLQSHATRPGRAYYVLPDIGTSGELIQSASLISRTWLVDVRSLHALMQPTTRTRLARRSGNHLVDLQPPVATFHSDPVETPLLAAADLASWLATASPAKLPQVPEQATPDVAASDSLPGVPMLEEHRSELLGPSIGSFGANTLGLAYRLKDSP